ncbi:hypothetical protein B0F90DRAFT_1677932 [Multifurca ochricompacta]|uniref:ER membrane protein complex subunit 7 beta-sandwich domain-containing protein n=1 Tax=Multifurca ochricompacta TaxID=376703 RepID=A0AAD4QTX6_9AGAM|nr:hypothetical protein B0F90DRAFT_1677932 [Multifurca ochricompacta]
MTRIILTIAVLFAYLSARVTTLAAELSGFVQWNEHCADSLHLGHAKVVLDNAVSSGTITRDGEFVIPDVTAGTYIVSVVARDHVFEKACPTLFIYTFHLFTYPGCDIQLRVDVSPEPESPPEVRPYTVGTPLNPRSPIKLPYPIKLVPRQRKSYFIPHQSFDVVQMFQNPMMLVMVFGGLMMLAMPYITVRASLIPFLFSVAFDAANNFM